MPLLPLPECLGAQSRVFQEGTDDRQLRLFGLGGGQKHMKELPHRILTHFLFRSPGIALTFKVLRSTRTRCNLSLSKGSLALWVKQRRSSCLLHGFGSPRAVKLACSRARYSCSSPSDISSSRLSDTLLSRPSEILLSLLSTLNSRRSETPRSGSLRGRSITAKMNVCRVILGFYVIILK